LKKVRVAVAGPGDFARVCHIPGIRSHSRAEVTAVCGRDATRAAAFAEQEGIARSFADLDQMLSADICDAVAIATPDASHHNIALKAIAAGKHVFCEKPLAMSVSECARMMEAAGEAGVINMVAFTFRYMHALREMKRLIYSGKVGKPFHVSLQVYWDDLLAPSSLSWREQASYSAAGIWADAGAHLFDAIAYLFAPVDEVYAQLDLVQREPGCAQPDTTDLAHCLSGTHCLYAGKQTSVSVSFTASRLSIPRGPVHELQVFGSKGSLGMPLTRGNDEYLSFLPADSHTWETITLPPEASTPEPLALGRMMRAFVDAILSGKHDSEHDATFRNGLDAQLALEAGIKSAGSRRAERVEYNYRDGALKTAAV
jgi:predicted dehydrogenase